MSVELHLGDCLEVMKSMPDKSVDAIITDLPYGTTACSWDEIIPFEPMWEQVKRICKGVFVTTASQPFTTDIVNSNRKHFRYELIWDKKQAGNFIMAGKVPLKKHENILVFYNGYHVYNPIMEQVLDKDVRPVNNIPHINNINGVPKKPKDTYDNTIKYPSSILQFGARDKELNSKKRVHPTQKPVALYEYLIRTYTNEGDTVLDITMGSGTTGVACVQTGRNFIGIEIDPNYFAIAERRIKEAQAQPRLEEVA